MSLSSPTLNALLDQWLTDQNLRQYKEKQFEGPQLPREQPDYLAGEGWARLEEGLRRRDWLDLIEQRFGRPFPALNVPAMRGAVLQALLTLASPERRCAALEQQALEGLGFAAIRLPSAGLLRLLRTELRELGAPVLLQLFASPSLGEDHQQAVVLLPTYLDLAECHAVRLAYPQRRLRVIESPPFSPARRVVVIPV